MELESVPFRQQPTRRTIWGSASFCILVGHVGKARCACSLPPRRTRGRGYLGYIQYLDTHLG